MIGGTDSRSRRCAVGRWPAWFGALLILSAQLLAPIHWHQNSLDTAAQISADTSHCVICELAFHSPGGVSSPIVPHALIISTERTRLVFAPASDPRLLLLRQVRAPPASV